MRNTLSRIGLGLLTLALCGLVSSRVLAQPVQPKQMPPTPPVAQPLPTTPRSAHDITIKQFREKPAPVAPTPNPKMTR